jgi:hypothetical protein
MSKQLVLRVIFLAAIAGALLFWSRQRRPRDLPLQIDLTSALPGEIVELDVTVRRGGHALARHDVTYGKSGAPGVVEMSVHAFPGPAEVETTLVYPGKPARRVVSQVALAEKQPSRVTISP